MSSGIALLRFPAAPNPNSGDEQSSQAAEEGRAERRDVNVRSNSNEPEGRAAVQLLRSAARRDRRAAFLAVLIYTVVVSITVFAAIIGGGGLTAVAWIFLGEPELALEDSQHLQQRF